MELLALWRSLRCPLAARGRGASTVVPSQHNHRPASLLLREMSGTNTSSSCPCPGSLFPHQRQGRPHRTVSLNPQPCNCGEFQILGPRLQLSQALSQPALRRLPALEAMDSLMSPNRRHVVIRARLALVVSPRPRVDRLTVADAGDGERAVVSPQRRTDVLESVGAAFRYLTPRPDLRPASCSPSRGPFAADQLARFLWLCVTSNTCDPRWSMRRPSAHDITSVPPYFFYG